MEQIFSQLALVASLVERAVQFVKPLYQERFAQYQKTIDLVLVIGFNLGLCYAWQVDLFSAAGFSFPTPVGSLLTGVFSWLGSEVIHTLVEILVAFRKGLPQPQG